MSRKASVNNADDIQPVNVRLPTDLHAAIIARSVAEDRTMAQTIRVALRYYLANTSPGPQERPLTASFTLPPSAFPNPTEGELS